MIMKLSKPKGLPNLRPFVMYCIYVHVQAIPTYRVYLLYDTDVIIISL